MNLYTIAEILRAFRDGNVQNKLLSPDVNINVDVENPSFRGEHTDDDSITLHMPNGDVWRLQMDKVK